MSKRAWVISSLVGPTAFASFGGGMAQLGDAADARAAGHASRLADVAASALGYGLIAAGAASLLLVLALVVTCDPELRTAATGELPAAQVLQGPDRSRALERAFPTWLVPLLLIAATIGVDRLARHMT